MWPHSAPFHVKNCIFCFQYIFNVQDELMLSITAEPETLWLVSWSTTLCVCLRLLDMVTRGAVKCTKCNKVTSHEAFAVSWWVKQGLFFIDDIVELVRGPSLCLIPNHWLVDGCCSSFVLLSICRYFLSVSTRLLDFVLHRVFKMYQSTICARFVNQHLKKKSLDSIYGD